DLIQKYPEERELVDRAKVYLTVCERQRRDPRTELTQAEAFYYDALPEEKRRRQGGVPGCLLLRAAGRARDGRRTSPEGDRRGSASPRSGAPRSGLRPRPGDGRVAEGAL